MLKILQSTILAFGLMAVCVSPAQAVSESGETSSAEVSQSSQSARQARREARQARREERRREREARRRQRQEAEETAHAAPELDPTGAAAGVLVVVGVCAMWFDRRRRA